MKIFRRFLIMKAAKIIGLILPFLCLACSPANSAGGESSISNTPSSLPRPTSSGTAKKSVVKDLNAIGLDNQTYDMSLFKGKLTLINVWGTYCTPCKAEMPALAHYHKLYGKSTNFQVVGIVIDCQYSDLSIDPVYHAKAIQLCEDAGVTYTSLFVSKELIPFINPIEYIPYSVFIDENGDQLGDAIEMMLTAKEWGQVIDDAIVEYN